MKNRLLTLLTIISCFVFSCSVAFAACTDPREVIKSAKDPKQKTILIAMHRGVWGDGTRLPENSMGAFIAADRMCYGAIETDVRLTSDNVPVMLHDKTFGRTTDVFRYQGPPFDPETNVGSNPLIPNLPWTRKGDEDGAEVSGLKLLVEPNYHSSTAAFKNLTGYGVETVKSFYDEYLNNRLSVVVFLEIKDKNAVPIVLKQLFSDRRDYNYHLGSKPLYATEFTIIKFNADTFPTAKDYRDALAAAKLAANASDDIPNPLAFPAYASNTLQFLVNNHPDKVKDPYRDSIKTWVDDTEIRIGIELNLKEKGGILQEAYDEARKTGKVTIGTFHAEPDFLRVNPERSKDELLPNMNDGRRMTIKAGDAFYQGDTGACCYQLSDLLGTTWQGKKDTTDNRPDPNFIVHVTDDNPDFRIITTDNYKAIVNAASKAQLDFVFDPSVLASERIFVNGINAGVKDKDGAVTYDNIHNITLTNTGALTSDVDMKLPILGSPAVAAFNGTTYLFYRRPHGDHVYYRVQDAAGWSQEFSTGLYIESLHPSVTVFQGALYVFANDWAGHRLKFARSYDGKQWDLNHNIIDRNWNFINIGDDSTPTVFNGRLYLFYGYDPRWNQYISDPLWYTTFDGASWTPPEKVEGVTLDHPPAIVPLNGKLHVIHHTREHKIYCSSFDGLSWNANNQIAGIYDTSELAVTASGARLKLYYRDARKELASMISFDCKTWSSRRPPFNAVAVKSAPAVLP